jgi:glyoxylase-like metal-dependent hydrolase (beta-lactamase superfamily II)
MVAPVHHEHGIVTLDADYVRPGLASVHLMIEQGRAAVIDTGTNHSVPSILAELQHLGLSVEAVDFVIVTHVHLDHAGAAGTLLRLCPNARLVVHPQGARHLIDPAKLVAGSIAVYGEENFAALYGEIEPAPAERVIEAEDGFELNFNGRVLRFLDTPGHARHHFCIFDERSQSIFTGDTLGISYREFDVDGRVFILPAATPVQFDPPAMHASIERLMALQPRAAFLTHYGRITDLAAPVAGLHGLIDDYVRLALAAPGEGAVRHAALRRSLLDLLVEGVRRHGSRMPEAECRALLTPDSELNAQGLLVWRDRMAQGK